MMRDVAFVLFPKFSMIALFGALEPLRIANRFAGPIFSWQFLASKPGPVAASNGIEVIAQKSLADIGKPALAMFCASYEPEHHYTRAVVAQVRQLARRGVMLGGLDTGPFLLAEAGVLDGHRATCHWESLPGFRENYPRLNAMTSLYEFDGDRMTCAGGSAAIDMMIDYIGRCHGPRLAVTVADQLVHFRSVEPPMPQGRLPARLRFNVDDARLLAVIEAMEQHLEDVLNLADLARVAGLSPRQLERVFNRVLDTTPHRFYEQLRLAQAEQLLSYSRLRIGDVAVACGFGGLPQFSRAFTKAYGHSPSAHRRVA